jgi:phosphatidylserine decarboxylase
MSSLPITADAKHQYIDRASGGVKSETLFGDGPVGWLYSTARESNSLLLRLATSAWVSRLLAHVSYDSALLSSCSPAADFVRRLGIDETECVTPLGPRPRMRDVFERKIRYWECRPMPDDFACVLSPCDARMLHGSFVEQPLLQVKEKFFNLSELLGPANPHWLAYFAGGDWAIFRLTPEKYHYNHVPVTGDIVDFYPMDGQFHSCNPSAVIALATTYSKNLRVVTIIDSDVPGGAGVGLVAMIEVAALMVGNIVQCYAEQGYASAGSIHHGMRIERGAVKSLFRPGSSTVILLFEPGRISFDVDLVANAKRQDVRSRFSRHFGEGLVETDVAARSSIATRRDGPLSSSAPLGAGNSITGGRDAVLLG